MKTFFVYVMTNRSRVVLYTGITKSLERRCWYHRFGNPKSFTSRYKVDRLVYYECFNDARSAIAREKEIKGWRREKKNALVRMMNPSWKDLGRELFGSGSGKVTAREQAGNRIACHPEPRRGRGASQLKIRSPNSGADADLT